MSSFSSYLRPGSSASMLFTSARPSASRYSSHGANACSSWRRETPSRIGISAWTWTSCRMGGLGRCSGRGVILPLKSRRFMLPDYTGNSLLNLVASLAAARGAAPRHPTLGALAPQEFADARNIVFLIIDGLGDGYLRRRGAGGELARRRRGAITSVFPSTTATAITTSY